MRFLVPVDFSEITNPLLRTVKSAALPHGAKVTLLHVIPPVIYLPYPETFGISVVDIETLERIEREKEKEAEEKLKALSEFLAPLETEIKVEVGDPADVILEYGEREKPDLIFLGSHKKGLVEKILIGSTTEKVVKHSKVSNFVVKGEETDFKGEVVVAYDFSETSQKTVEFAERFLKPFEVSKVTLLHVNEPLELPLIDKLKQRFHEELVSEKRRILEEIKERFEKGGKRCEVLFLEGRKAFEEIVKYVNDNKEVELLIVGGRGLSGLRRLILGNTATRLIEKVNKPILVYKVSEE